MSTTEDDVLCTKLRDIAAGYTAEMHVCEQAAERITALLERVAELERDAAKAAAAEREQCAQVCDQRAAMYMPVNRDAVGKASQLEARICADAIRARGAATQPAGDTGVQP